MQRQNAEIIAVGSELLLGQIANTNGQFLSAELAGVGINVYYHSVVGDNPNRLFNLMEEATKRSDIIILTGGLGPTKDDLTKHTVAKLLDKPLVYDDTALDKIKNYYHRKQETMTENNKQQALVIEGSDVLANRTGMAPGMMADYGLGKVVLLPGPPSEMKPMFLEEVKPRLLKSSTDKITSRVLRFFGIGESTLETRIMDMIDQQSNPTIAPLAKDNEVTLRLTASGEDALERLQEVEQRIRERVGDYFYGYGERSLAETTFDLLNERGLTIAAAESLTGGWFSKTAVDFPGTSNVLKGSIVCYTNEMKEDIVNVAPAMLKEKGAVSTEVAEAMARNIRKITKANLGIAFTGVAGPDASEGNAPGTVYIAIADAKRTQAFRYLIQGDRTKIRSMSVKRGWDLLRRYLMKYPPFQKIE